MQRIGLVLALAGCGRVGFDAAADARADGGPEVPAGAVLYLPFNAAPVGTSVEDLARNHAVSCAPTGCPSLVPGKRGGAYRFDPAHPDYLQAPFVADLDPTSGFTIAIWVRLASLPTGLYTCFLGKAVGGGTANSHELCVAQDSTVLFHSGNAAATDNLFGSPIPLGEWHHLAMTWDGVTKRGYFDGVPDGMRDVPVGNDGSPIMVGADLNNGSAVYWMDGDLDEVLVFDRALSAPEIGQLAQ